jgi:hypothetical protein
MPKINNIRWDRLIPDILKMFIPIPAMLLLIGVIIFHVGTMYMEAEINRLILTPTTTNTLLVFIMMAMGSVFFCTGILYVKLNLMEAPKHEESYYLKDGN